MRQKSFHALPICAILLFSAAAYAQDPGQSYFPDADFPQSGSGYSPQSPTAYAPRTSTADTQSYLRPSAEYGQHSSGFPQDSRTYAQDTGAYSQTGLTDPALAEWTPGEILPPEPASATAANGANTGYEMHSVDQILDPPTYPNARMSGFFQLDTAWFGQSASNRASVGDIQDGTDFRRARLQALGDIYENIGFSLEFDFAFPGRPSFMDVWLEARQAFGDSNLRIGQYRQPISMDGLTSVKELTFLERGLPFALIPFRQVGAMLWGTTPDEEGTYAIGLFRYPTDVFAGQIGDNGGYGFITRLTSLTVDEGDDMLVHIGGAYSFIDPANDAVRYANQPEIFVAETGGAALVPPGVPTAVPPFVNTGVIATNNVNLFGAEFAARMNQLHIQSEFLASVVNRIGGGSVVFPGAYVQAGYLLTGEVRPYNKKGGVLGRIKPINPVDGRGGIGAWEVAGRWSWLDLNSHDVRGGALNDLTLGLNWYLNNNTKFQFNYIHAFLQNQLTNIHSSADIAAMRAQIDF